MDPEVQNINPDFVTEPETIRVDINNGEETVTLAQLPPSREPSDEQWQQVGRRFSTFVTSDIPNFYEEYKRPLSILGLALLAFIAVRLTFAVIDALNDIPLLSPTFELIGMGYTGWFAWRYLLRASTREELREDFNSFKEQILGGTSLE